MRRILLICLLLIAGDSTLAESPYEIDWGRQFGTSLTEHASAVAVDAFDDVIVAGYTYGNLGGAGRSGIDMYLKKYTSTGDEVWTQQYITPGNELAHSIALDGSGNIFVTGAAGSSSSGSESIFISKLDRLGQPLWSKKLGASSDSEGSSIAIDSQGSLYVTGHTSGSLGGAHLGSRDVFLAKFNASGEPEWIEQFGTRNSDWGTSVAVDAFDNVYVGGQAIFNPIGPDHLSGFVWKYDPSGELLWNKSIARPAESLTVDHENNVYAVGTTNEGLFGPHAGAFDAFVLKLNDSGDQLWSRQFGSRGNEFAESVTVDLLGNIFVSGNSHGDGNSLYTDQLDAALTKFSASGVKLWTQLVGSDEWDRGESVAVDSRGNVYMSGYAQGSIAGQNYRSGDGYLIKFAVPEPNAIAFAATGLLLTLRRPRK
jgi:hypothetical protein